MNKAIALAVLLSLTPKLFCQDVPKVGSRAYLAWHINPGQHAVPAEDAKKYWAICAEASEFYAESGLRRSPTYLKPYLESALRVSGMVPDFPGAHRLDNALKFFSWGAIEGMFVKNYVAVNVPGLRHPRLGLVRGFSIDYGWSGVNEQNIKWTRQYARALQRGVLPSRDLRSQVCRGAQEFLAENARIPKALVLKQVSTRSARLALAQWKSTGSKKHSSYDHLLTGFREEGLDDLDSMMLYRVIVEVDRKYRGWPYQTWEKTLYRRLAAKAI